VVIGEGAAGGPDAGTFIGNAKDILWNVAPRAGGVAIWINIDWGATPAAGRFRDRPRRRSNGWLRRGRSKPGGEIAIGKTTET
jgi:hypothetical protein